MAECWGRAEFVFYMYQERIHCAPYVSRSFLVAHCRGSWTTCWVSFVFAVIGHSLENGKTLFVSYHLLISPAIPLRRQLVPMLGPAYISFV